MTVTTEHKAVLDPMARLAHDGWRVTVVPVSASGLIDLAVLESAVTERTALVSVMAANNEIGVLQPIKDAAAIAHAKGAWFHTDAVQAAGQRAVRRGRARRGFRVADGPQDLRAEGRRRVVCAPRASAGGACDRAEIDGGGHERGMRSGTLNVPGIVGFGRAAEIARAELASEATRVGELRDRLLERLAREDGRDDGERRPMDSARLPGNLNVSFAGIDGEALLVSLDDIAVSSGAACTQAEPSHVLMALGLSKDRALASLRFGIGRSTTTEEIEYAAQKVGDVVNRLPMQRCVRCAGAKVAARCVTRTRCSIGCAIRNVPASLDGRTRSARVRLERLDEGTVVRIQVQKERRSDCRGAVQGVWLQRRHREREPGGRVARRRADGRGEAG